MSEENNSNTGTALAVVTPNQLTYKDVESWGGIFFKSGMFEDLKNAAGAMVKIKCGDELGITPFAAMNGIHLIKGKASIGAGLQAGLVQRSSNVRYEVVEMTSSNCTLEFFKKGVVDGKWKSVGLSSFSMKDAEAAKLAGSDGQNKAMYSKWSRNMLFARAMTNGVRWYSPELLLGSEGYAGVVDDFDADEVAKNTAGKPKDLPDETTPEAIERRGHVVDCLLRIGGLLATPEQMIALKSSIDASTLASLEERYINALSKAREHVQKAIGEKYKGDAFSKFIQEAFPAGINAAGCVELFDVLDSLSEPPKAAAASATPPAETPASETPTEKEDEEINEGPLTVEEEARLMLIDVIAEQLKEKTGGDIAEMDKLIGDRVFQKMSTEELQKFYNELVSPF